MPDERCWSIISSRRSRVILAFSLPKSGGTNCVVCTGCSYNAEAAKSVHHKMNTSNNDSYSTRNYTNLLQGFHEIADFSFTVTHIPCGSIISGQRRELDTMIPLSMLKLSTGRPAICQARTLTASPRTALREKTLEQGIFFERHFLCQSFIQSCKHRGCTVYYYAACKTTLS